MITSYRLYHVSAVAFNVKKLGVRLNKMINPKNKKHWYQSHTTLEPVLPTLKSLTNTKNEPGKRAIKRSAMLNKLFMKHITDIMSTGTVAIDVVGKGIEISKVKITPDFQKVNVFWVCKGDASDKETEELLSRIAGPLRHELSTLRVMGEVPYIEFIKDLNEARIVDLDKRLREADYGEDYETTQMGDILKSEFVLNTKLSPEMKAKIKQLEQEIPTIEEPIPEMTHNIYGLEHDKILNRLLAARKKNKDAWEKVDEESVISYRVNENKPADVYDGNQRKELAEFLLKRKILQNKIHKESRRTDENWQLELNKEDDQEDVYEDDYIDDYDQIDVNDDFYYKHDFGVNKKDGGMP